MKKALFISLALIAMTSAATAADPAPASARQYPGGADEQDLKVQPQLVPPTAKIDRRTMDQKALNNFLRKTGQAPAATNSKAKPKQ